MNDAKMREAVAVEMDRKLLIERAFYIIMELEETKRVNILEKYAERYGWYVPKFKETANG